MTLPAKLRSLITNWSVPLVATATMVLICLTLDPAGDSRGGWDGPGLTLDEPFHVGQGVELAGRLFAGDLPGFRRVDSQLIDHPPAGRLWLGLVHELVFLASPPLDPSVPYSIRCARVGSAILFALTIWRVGAFAQSCWGGWAGLSAAVSLVLMPRSFGHAHLASLETPVNLLYLLCLLAVAEPVARIHRITDTEFGVAGPGRRPVAWRELVLVGIRAGFWLGLALLTKMQAVFLPVALGIWAICWWRTRAVVWLGIVGLVAMGLFYLGWPQLWPDPWEHAWSYFARSTHRISLKVWYGGRAMADHEVPWHYPLLIFGLSVPVGLQLLGAWGSARSLRSLKNCPAEALLLLGIGVPLAVFSLPGVPVYDGERLFSVVYAPWAVLIGKGFQSLSEWSGKRVPGIPRVLIGPGLLLMICLTQSAGLFRTAPCWLQYYNLACWGLPGAERLGLSPGYWGDGVTRSFLREVATKVPPGSTIHLAPVLYAAQSEELLRQCPELRQRRIRIIPRKHADEKPVFSILYNRPEYLPQDLREKPPVWIAVQFCEGVWQAGLCREE